MRWQQRAVWGNEKDICRQIQASLICRRPPFSKSLRDSRPAAHADPRLVYVVNQTRRNPTAPEMTALAVNNAQRYSRISKSDRIELARFQSSFVLRRISGALDNQANSIDWRKLFGSVIKPVRPNGVQRPKRAFGAELEGLERPERLPVAGFQRKAGRKAPDRGGLERFPLPVSVFQLLVLSFISPPAPRSPPARWRAAGWPRAPFCPIPGSIPRRR